MPRHLLGAHSLHSPRTVLLMVDNNTIFKKREGRHVRYNLQAN